MKGPKCECGGHFKWIRSWYGDPNVINGTQDDSHWECDRCDSIECEENPNDWYTEQEYERDPAMEDWSRV